MIFEFNYIHWISRKAVCLPKEKRGLRIKDITYFNKSLMLKWKWRFITDEVALWKGILEHMYSAPSSSLALAVMSNDGVGGRKYDYIWWRHIISLGYDKEKSSDLFVGNILGTLSDRRRISFWHYKWFPNQSLK